MKQESLIQTEAFPQINPFTRIGHQSLNKDVTSETALR